MTFAPLLPELSTTVARDGFAFMRAGAMRRLLDGRTDLADWDAFAASWNDLRLDTYMADGGRYRRRRFAVFSAAAGDPAITREPHQPHYQARSYNQLNGDIDRWFEPVLPEIGAGAAMTGILRTARALFDSITPDCSWHIEVHQFRIEARPGEAGQPTPEGMHRDGVDHVLVLMVGRTNIKSGETSVADLQGRPLGSFTLTDPLDAAWVEDARVMHGVTAVAPVDPALPAHRDVLVATFRRETR